MDRTHFLLAMEYNPQDRDAVITSQLAPGLYSGHFRQPLFLARVDHQLNKNNPDATRPITPVANGYRAINSLINEGTSNYDALQTRRDDKP